MLDHWKLQYPLMRHIHTDDACLTYGRACADAAVIHALDVWRKEHGWTEWSQVVLPPGVLPSEEWGWMT